MASPGQVDIQATFPYFGQLNPLRVVFVQSTILNQADIGNELVPDLTVAVEGREWRRLDGECQSRN